ncbi:hypothetical protein F5148DRAFT_904796 [Russula earlei]|uniref:Uncharacterized protein n=1 Tax=Russula earlei TaxID=71964 RepID=A0ACC0ULJ7_9AGAM|nr:hypothetical protein F5148DRAFT_904796 [Russula earlei]
MHSGTASVNGHEFQISVSTKHTLDDQETEISLPFTIDSHLVRSIDFSFSGTVHHSTSIPPIDMLRSSVVQSFHRYLTLNGEHLGVTNISDVTLCVRSSSTSGSSGIPTVSVTPVYCPSSQILSGLSIFSPQSLLPLQPALNELMRKLFAIHIVGRYPWLFGPLRIKLRLEQQWFPSLVRSLLAITGRSRNLVFRNKIQVLIKKIENYVLVYKQISDAACGHLSSPQSCLSGSPALDTSDTLILALELILKVATRPPPFKVLSAGVTQQQSARLPMASSSDGSLGLSTHLSPFPRLFRRCAKLGRPFT